MAEKKTETVINQAGTQVEVSPDRAKVLKRRAEAFTAIAKNADLRDAKK